MLISRFPPTLGGAEIQCSRLSAWLARQGHEVVVLTEKSSPGQASRERIQNFDVIRFRTVGGLPWSSLCYGVQAFFYLFAHPRFDVLHAHMIATPAMVATAASFFSRTPVLIKVAGGRRTGDFSTSRTYQRGKLKLWMFKRKNPYVVCPSQETLQEAKSFGVPEDRLTYIPNGIDTDYFKPSPKLKSQRRASFQWPEDKPIAIYIGRWAKGKGVETLLDVWEAGVSHPDFPWHLAMILSEPAPESIAARMQRLKGRLHTAFGVTETQPYYQAADVAILLSEGEGLSNFLLEAMACGLPTLTTAAAALPDAAGEKTGTCTLVSGYDAAKETLAFLIETRQAPERLTAMGGAARRHIEQHYSLDRIGRSYLALYERMIKI